MNTPEPPNVAKFLALLHVPEADAKPFCRAVHEDWASDLSELLFYKADNQPYFSWEYPLKSFMHWVPDLLKSHGIGYKKLARPKKGIPPGDGWEVYSLQLTKDGAPPVKPLLLWKEGSALPYLKTLNEALTQLGMQLYLDVCRIDGDSMKVFPFSDADWIRVGDWLGTTIRDRLLVPVSQVPDTDEERLALQWQIWTGTDPSERPGDYRIWSERNWKCCHLSKAFLDEHKATLDAIGEWDTDGASNYLEIKWKRPAGVDQSWVPLDLALSRESSYEEHIGCSVGRFDPTPEMMELLQRFLANQKEHLAKARAVIATWSKKQPKWGQVEIRHYSGSADLSVAPQYKKEEETNPTRCHFDPATDTWG